MRENMGLYRGKRTSDGQWVKGYLLRECHQHEEVIAFEEPEWVDGWEWNLHDFDFVVPNSVGQYTGLTDKNGIQIFEGDVVSGLFLYALPINGVCAFREGAFGLEWERGGAKEFTAFTSMCNVEFEVVGNVHDNPELKGDC